LLPPSSPREQESPWTVFHNYSFYLDDAPIIIPSSPSRCTSKEQLPEGEEDSFGLKLLGAALPSSPREAPSDSRQSILLPSFSGTETDDDLILVEFASKSYIPESKRCCHTTPPTQRCSGTPATARIRDATDLPPMRYPPPEDFIFDLNMFMVLEGQKIWKEMRRIRELRERAGKMPSCERGVFLFCFHSSTEAS